MGNPYLLAGALFAIMGAYVYGHHAGAVAERGTSARQELLIARAAQAAQESAAREIRSIVVKNTTIRQKVEEKIREVPVYADCRHDPNVLRLLNDALTGASSEPAHDRGVPGTDSSD